MDVRSDGSRASSYWAKLQDPRWQKKRLEILYVLKAMREWRECDRAERFRKACWILDALSDLCGDGNTWGAAMQPMLSGFRASEIDSDIAIGSGCGS